MSIGAIIKCEPVGMKYAGLHVTAIFKLFAQLVMLFN